MMSSYSESHESFLREDGVCPFCSTKPESKEIWTFRGGAVHSKCFKVSGFADLVEYHLGNSRLFQIVVYIGLVAVLGVLPWVLLYKESWSQLILDARHFLFVGTILSIFVINFFFYYLLAKGPGERFVQLIVLMVAVASFYAFGWPKDLSAGGAQELPHKFSELSVILVLFLLSELAVRLNFNASKLSGQMETISKEFQGELVRLLPEFRDAALEIRNAKLGQMLASFSSHTAVLRSTAQILREVQEGVESLETQKELLDTAGIWVKSWVEVIQGGSERKSQLVEKCLRYVFRQYAEDERRSLDRSHLEFPRQLLNANGSPGMRLTDFIIANRGLTPMVVATEETYLNILSAFARTVSQELGESDRLLYWPTTNLLPKDWYNWRREDGFGCRFTGIEAYKKMIADVCGGNAKVKMSRMIVTQEENDPILEDRFGIKSKSELRRQLTECYGLFIFRNGGYPPVLEDLPTFEDIGVSYLRRDLAAVKASAKGKEDVGVESLSVFENCPQDEPDLSVFPILSKEDIKELGLENIEPDWRSGKAVRYDASRDSALFAVPLGDIFQKDLHLLGDAECWVATINKSELEKFPDRRPDMLMLGIDHGGNGERWLLAISTALVPGDQTMSMRLLFEKEILDHLLGLRVHLTTAGLLDKLTTLSGDHEIAEGSEGARLEE